MEHLVAIGAVAAITMFVAMVGSNSVSPVDLQTTGATSSRGWSILKRVGSGSLTRKKKFKSTDMNNILTK